MSHRYFIKLSYKGTCFHGWQIQPNSTSIQETLNKALTIFLRTEIYVVGSGRTDTGVHARNYIAHFDSPIEILNKEDLIYKTNRYIHQDIVIHDIIEVSPDLHSRFNAISRTYQYRIHLKKDPFIAEFSTFLRYKPDVEKMNHAAKLLFKYSDFTSFSKLHSDAKSNECVIYHAHWTKNDYELVFEIKADRFLRNMVRSIVGTLLDVGCGKMDFEEFEKIIKSKNRSNAGISMPAQGLSLVEVAYNNNIF